MVGQADRLEIKVRVDVAVLSLNATGQQAGNSGRVSMLQFFRRISSPLSNLSLSRSSTDWMSPTHIMDSTLLYSMPTDLNVNYILKNTFTATCCLVFGYHRLATLTHKIDLHRILAKSLLLLEATLISSFFQLEGFEPRILTQNLYF